LLQKSYAEVGSIAQKLQNILSGFGTQLRIQRFRQNSGTLDGPKTGSESRLYWCWL